VSAVPLNTPLSPSCSTASEMLTVSVPASPSTVTLAPMPSSPRLACPTLTVSLLAPAFTTVGPDTVRTLMVSLPEPPVTVVEPACVLPIVKLSAPTPRSTLRTSTVP
jgi:hypothetical protein